MGLALLPVQRIERLDRFGLSLVDAQRALVLLIAERYAAAIHSPLRLEAATLSRIPLRSAVTSRSNCAKDSSICSVSRPMLVAVLKD